MRRVVVSALVAVSMAACGSSSGSKPAPVAAVAPTTTVTTGVPVPATSLTVAGVGPGVEQAPFYPTTTVTSVACGSVPGGGHFVQVTIPAGGPPTSASSVLAQPTTVVVVPGKAVLKDHTGKVLYEQDMPSITTGSNGALVLSLDLVSYIGGDGRSASAGAVNVEGNFACPAASSPFPGV